MKTDLYKKVEKLVVDSFSRLSKDTKHHIRTVYWIKKLKPDVDEALLIAAVAHDINRSSIKNRKEELKLIKESRKGGLDKRFLKKHQKQGAEIIGKFLEKQGADKKLIKKVKILVFKHEEGGSRDQNLLKDADSLSFFENNINRMIEIIPRMGKKKIREKIDWMYNRITSKKAKKIAEPYYLNVIKKIKL